MAVRNDSAAMERVGGSQTAGGAGGSGAAKEAGKPGVGGDATCTFGAGGGGGWCAAEYGSHHSVRAWCARGWAI